MSVRASSHDPGSPGWLAHLDEIGSDGDFQPGVRDEKWRRYHSGVKSNEQNWRE